MAYKYCGKDAHEIVANSGVNSLMDTECIEKMGATLFPTSGPMSVCLFSNLQIGCESTDHSSQGRTVGLV